MTERRMGNRLDVFALRASGILKQDITILEGSDTTPFRIDRACRCIPTQQENDGEAIKFLHHHLPRTPRIALSNSLTAFRHPPGNK